MGLVLLQPAACSSPSGYSAQAEGSQEADEKAPLLGAEDWGDGFVVWESARSGAWRIWSRRLDGSELRQLSPDESANPGEGGTAGEPRQHCCAHLSPDGRSLVYLSRLGPADRYSPWSRPGTLYLLDLDARLTSRPGPPPRVLSPAARTYGLGHRAAVWRNERELIYIDAAGRTRLLDIERHLARERDADTDGATDTATSADAGRILVDSQDKDLAWLVDPTLRHATTGVPSFSLFDPAPRGEGVGHIAERGELGGCEPTFSSDGRWGVWVHGAGGPLRAIDLTSADRGRTTLLRKNDERLGGQGYTYFPMLSRDARLLAFGASFGGHDHFKSNYDIFVAPIDPSTLQLLADPVRFTDDPGADRYPDVYLQPPAADESYAEVWTRPPPAGAIVEGAERASATDTWPTAGWLTDRRDLLFLWQTKEAPNLVPLGSKDGEALEGRAQQSSVNLQDSSLARIDRQGRLQLDGGRFSADSAWAEQVLQGVRDRNELSVELTVQPLPAALLPAPRAAGQEGLGEPATLVQLGRGGQTKLALAQRGRQLELRLQLGPTLETVSLVELMPGEVHHVAFTYTPGRLRAYLDGGPVLDSDQLQRDFFRWHQPMKGGASVPGWLGFGPWPGSLEGVAVYGRLLDEAEVRAHAESYAQLRARRPAVESRVIVAELVAKSATPTLDEIAPYVDALAVYEYRVIRWLGGEGKASATNDDQLLRVVHWVILDTEELPITKSALGSKVELTLEPYTAQPQLPEHVLSETLEPRYDLDLWFALRPFP